MGVLNMETHTTTPGVPGLAHRAYAGHADLEALKSFLIAQRARGLRGYMHVGDLLWHTHMHAQKNPARDVHLWFDPAGPLVGFVDFTPPGDFELQIAPELRGEGVLEPHMLAWVAEHSAQFGEHGAPPAKLTTAVIASDARSHAWFSAAGFTRDSYELFVLERDLSGGLDQPPDIGARGRLDMVVRHVAGEGEFAERVALHREVWHPSKVTAEGYAITRSAPGYDPELDLVAALPDGTFAAYGIAWRDDVNGVGEFEPVGTRATQRRKGYGAAVLLEGMRRLRDKGMTKAIVYCTADNLPFYGSVGFQVVDSYLGLTRPYHKG